MFGLEAGSRCAARRVAARRGWGLLGLALLAGCAASRQPHAASAPDQTAAPSADSPSAGAPHLVDAPFATLIADLRSSDSAARSYGRDTLTARGRAVTTELLPYLDDPSWELRWEIVNVLGYIADPRAVPGLVERTLADDNPHPRWRALWALSACDGDGSQSREVYVKELTGPNPRRRWYAAVALAFAIDPRALPYLEAGLKRPDPFERWEAVYSLASVHGEKTSAALDPLVAGDPDSSIRRQALNTLGAVCDERARAILARVLDDADPELRWRGALGLGRCGGDGAKQALETRLAIETTAEVKTQIQDALKSLTPNP